MSRRDARPGGGAGTPRPAGSPTTSPGAAPGSSDTPAGAIPDPPAGAHPVVETVEAFRQQVLGVPVADLDDQTRLELLHALEVLTRSLGAVTVHTQVAFHTSQVAHQIQTGVAPSRAGKGVPDDLGLARMTSPYWGSRELTSAKALAHEMPHTLTALRDGTINTYQARLITETTTCLSVEDRAEVDARLAPTLTGASTAEITATARALVYEVDPAGFVDRARKAAKDRGVTLRPRPDLMALLSARLPGPQAIACYTALRDKALAMQASGDPRTLAQLMADELYHRLTGRLVVDGIDVEVNLVITDTALFTGTSEAAHLDGYGPIPAELARELLRPTQEHDPDHHHDDENQPADQDQDQDRDRDADAHPQPTHPGTNDAPETTTSTTAATTPTTDDTRTGTAQTPTGAPHTTTSTPKATAAATENAASTPDASTSAAETTTGTTDGPASTNDAPAGTEAAAPGPVVPPGYCPQGGRCVSYSCTLLHGDPDARPPTTTPPASTTSPPPPATTGPPPPTTTGPSPPTGAPATGPAPGPGPRTAAGLRAATVWLRRLYTDPVTGTLTQRDPRKRLFTGALRTFLIARDRTCRNTWCGAAIRHIDHITRHTDNGLTQADNGQGLCAHCNLAREHPHHLDRPDATYRPPPPLLPTFLRAADARGP